MKARSRKQKQLLNELENNPLIERACKKVGIARSTYYRWCESDITFNVAAKGSQKAGREKMNDFVESKLLENINAGEMQAIRFWLTHNSKIYSTISVAEIKRLRISEGFVSELMDVVVKKDTETALRILNGLREQTRQQIEKENSESGL